jgi:Mn-dependent DtxR family transcriptional regulator
LGYFGNFENIMKLTKRQETFIMNLLDLYREAQQPIHYTVLAERLGVSRFTAYDMLRVLEDKGFVSSEYRLPEESRSGRSERVFLPTAYAHRFMAALLNDETEYNWASVKERILELLSSGEFADQDIGPEIIARVPPETDDNIQYCIEVVTILALHARHSEMLPALRRFALDTLPTEQTSSRAYLSLLGGFALGVLSQDAEHDADWQRELVSHVVQFQEHVLALTEEEGRRLTDGIREHFSEMQSLLPLEDQ